MRYFYHIVDGDREPDTQGIEFATEDLAKANACRYVGELLCDDPDSPWQHGPLRVEVTDQNGIHRWTVVSMALDAPPPDAHLLDGDEAGVEPR